MNTGYYALAVTLTVCFVHAQQSAADSIKVAVGALIIQPVQQHRWDYVIKIKLYVDPSAAALLLQRAPAPDIILIPIYLAH
jgi:hypothetical protein